MDNTICGGGLVDSDVDGSRGAKMANDDTEEAGEQDGEEFEDPPP